MIEAEDKMSSSIYEMGLLEQLAENSSYDYFFISAGVEERTYSTLCEMKRKNVNIKRLVVIDCEGRCYEIPLENKDGYEYYKQIGFDSLRIKSCVKKPEELIKSISEEGITLDCNTSIGLDITNMSHPHFFVLLKYLKEIVGIKNIDVFYTEPQVYSFQKGILGEYKNFVGELTAIDIPAYQGLPSENDKLLVMILGFEGLLSTFMYDNISPAKYVVIDGFPSYLPKYRDYSILFNKILSRQKCDNIYHSTANNPFETYNALKLIKEKYPDYEMNISPIGAKPMSLGACLFAMDYNMVKIVYPLPQKYTTRTSRGSASSWYYKIEF